MADQTKSEQAKPALTFRQQAALALAGGWLMRNGAGNVDSMVRSLARLVDAFVAEFDK